MCRLTESTAAFAHTTAVATDLPVLLDSLSTRQAAAAQAETRLRRFEESRRIVQETTMAANWTAKTYEAARTDLDVIQLAMIWGTAIFVNRSARSPVRSSA